MNGIDVDEYMMNPNGDFLDLRRWKGFWEYVKGNIKMKDAAKLLGIQEQTLRNKICRNAKVLLDEYVTIIWAISH